MIPQTGRATSKTPVPELEAPLRARQEAGAEASLLPAPGFVSGDPIAMIAKLLVKSSQQKRESDELSARSEEVAEDAADARRIDAMKSKADMTMAAGVAAGLSQVASGVGSLAGGCLGASELKTTSPTACDAARDVSAKCEGAGGVAGAGGKFVEAGFRSEADHFDRQVVDAEAGGKQAKRAQEQLRRQIDAGSQHEGKVMQLLQEIAQGQAQCAHAALLRMA